MTEENPYWRGWLSEPGFFGVVPSSHPEANLALWREYCAMCLEAGEQPTLPNEPDEPDKPYVPWRDLPPTERQLDVIDKHNRTATQKKRDYAPTPFTRGEAADIIDRVIFRGKK